MICFAQPAAQYRAHKEAVDAAVRRVMESGTYVLGDEVASFEVALAQYCHCQYAVGVGSGTDALILALRAFRIGQSDEVITVSHTAIATVAAVLAVGAIPVLVDVDPVYYTIDPRAFDLAITKQTKAIIVVHLYGQSADMEKVALIARRHHLVLIEDCAQALGGSYKGQRVGSFGDAACFSFYPTKNLGAIGDGGMIVTADPVIEGRVRRLRKYGWDKNRSTDDIGVNSCLDEIQAAILSAKLPSLDADNHRRAELAARYSDSLVGLPVTLPRIRPECRHVFYQYVIACHERDALMYHLAAANIKTGIHYRVPVHRHNGYARCVRLSGELVVTDRLADQILSLPIYPELGEEQVECVAEAIRSYYTSARSCR